MAVQYYNNFVDTTNFSDTTIQVTITTGTELTYTVPGNPTQRLQALFSYACTSNIFVGYNKTITIPDSNTVGTESFVEFKPLKRVVNGGDVLYFRTPDTIAYFGVSFRALPSGQ